jgi:SAM-dependent methyltransferase
MPNSSVLDVGCGDGSTLIHLALTKGCTGVGVDFAEIMVGEAWRAYSVSHAVSKLEFAVGEVPDIDIPDTLFDYAITERCLINLDSYDEQHETIKKILACVKPGGSYLMMEHSQQGLNQVNELREVFGLEPIVPPWHNLYMDDDLVDTWATELWRSGVADVSDIVYPASTYYLLSRVVYAKLASDEGAEPDYDSPINTIAVQLPQIGEFGYSKLWAWRKL